MSKLNFSLDHIFSEAVRVHAKGIAIMSPGTLVADPVSAISLGLALMFGTAGLPHILMRFFTVPDAKQARRSVFYATGFIGYFYILTFVIGFGAIVFISGNPEFKDAAGALIGGNNMAAIHLAKALGGNLLLGFISAVAFATILAVVSGLTLAGAAAVSHDLYAHCIMRGMAREENEIRVSKIATIGLGIAAIALGILFERQNIAFMVGLAFSIAASANFPVLIFSMFWEKTSTRGAMVGGWIGLISAVTMVIIGPIVWVDILGNAKPIFPYEYPAVFSMTAGMIGVYVFSMLDNSDNAKKERESFSDQFIRSMTGIGTEMVKRYK